MAALVFPPSPVSGQRFPVNPGVSGETQWQYDGVKWVVVPSLVSLGPTNQTAYNQYKWPLADGTFGGQLTTDGGGNLSWSTASVSSISPIGITPIFDGVSSTYTLTELGTMVFFSPAPSTNLVVFLGGVPQVPTVAYSVAGNQITFTDVPPLGATFYGISNVSPTASTSIQALGINPLFDGFATTFDLVLLGTPTVYAPDPVDNIVVFVGGVPQIPSNYTVVGNQITFMTPPPAGAIFYAITNV